MRSLRRFRLLAVSTLLLSGLAPTAGQAASRDRVSATVRVLGVRAGAQDVAGYAPGAFREVNRSLVPRERLARVKAAARLGSDTPVSREAGAPGARAPALSLGFDAIFEQIGTTPADPTGAVGTDFYVTAVNSHVAVYDRTGTEVVAPTRLRTLGGVLPAGAFDFDPKVIYDAYDDHFVLAFLAANSMHSWVVVAAIPGATADVPGTWCVTRLGGDQTADDGKQFADYPGLGYTADRVTLTTNQFDFATLSIFETAQILSLRKSQLYDPTCAASLVPKVFAHKATRQPDGAQAFTIQPAQTYGGVEPTTQFMASFAFSSNISGKKLVVWRLKTASGTLKLAKGFVSVGTAKIPPWGTQGGGSTSTANTFWDTGDLRLVNAAYDADVGTLYTAHAVEHDFSASTDSYVESGVRWYEIDPANTLSASGVLRKGLIGESRRDLAWPAIVPDSAGVLHLTYSQASAPLSEYLSAYAATVQPAATGFAAALLHAGEARYEASTGPERWGDYNAASRDPLDGTYVALVNQYPVSDGVGSTLLWQQWVELVFNT